MINKFLTDGKNMINSYQQKLNEQNHRLQIIQQDGKNIINSYKQKLIDLDLDLSQKDVIKDERFNELNATLIQFTVNSIPIILESIQMILDSSKVIIGFSIIGLLIIGFSITAMYYIVM